ncbi:uncharacterized protein KY384_002741 [Bacidia gigantensis]|uniref:uncharacterized protein n=1 Tax=Bacidia gigantensis TaxID=2732470 RepID=UPI001D045DEE|nr:uncharacterized protein KY384_002741 [Bacidia gigantensis]KAG8532863.1 hypothetical protein KY384_002741 [Bacidia gigantensis]
MADSPVPSPSQSPPIPDSPTASQQLQLPLSASLVLTNLPQDAHAALAQASENPLGVPTKVTIRFTPIGSAPQLRQKVFKVSSSNRFETVVAFLTKKLAATTAAAVSQGEKEGGGGGSREVPHVFCYVNSVFAPALDEGVGGLWKVVNGDESIVHNLIPK